MLLIFELWVLKSQGYDKFLLNKRYVVVLDYLFFQKMFFKLTTIQANVNKVL